MSVIKNDAVDIPVKDNFEFQLNATKNILRDCRGIAREIEAILWNLNPDDLEDATKKEVSKSYWDLTTENKCGAEKLKYLLQDIKERL